MKTLFFALVALSVADVALTHQVLRRGGRELNPVLARLFERANPVAVMVAIKAAVLIPAYVYLDLVPLLAIQLLVVFYAVLAVWNLSQLARKHQDKALHVAAGALVGLSVFVVGPVNAAGLALAVGLIKEMYDSLSERGTAEVLDVVATVAGGLLSVGVFLIGA